MGGAFGLVSEEEEEGAEYKIAAQLDWDGELFASFTSKKKAKLAELLLESHMDGHYWEGHLAMQHVAAESTDDLNFGDLDRLMSMRRM